MAERSRRGWVVRINSYSGRQRGNYLVPFRALRPHGQNWCGKPLFAGLERALKGIPGVVRTNDLKGSSPTGWPVTARLRARRERPGRAAERADWREGARPSSALLNSARPP
jgi:hypothetical protein